jgi:hypothetical protein
MLVRFIYHKARLEVT